MKQLFNDFKKLTGITQTKFADKVGISRMTVYNALNNNLDKMTLRGQILWHLKEILIEKRNKESKKYNDLIKQIELLGGITNEKA